MRCEKRLEGPRSMPWTDRLLRAATVVSRKANIWTVIHGSPCRYPHMASAVARERHLLRDISRSRPRRCDDSCDEPDLVANGAISAKGVSNVVAFCRCERAKGEWHI